MEALQIQYKGLKEVAKTFMTNGNLQSYFNTIKQANAIQMQILQQNISTK